MDEGAAQWDRIAHSPLALAYLSEVHWLAHGIVEGLADVFAEATVPEPGESYIRVDFGLQRRIHGALGDAARLRQMIEHRPKRKRQSPLAYEVQRRRIAWVNEQLDGLPTSALRDARVRNSLEHFDEYLDQTGLDGLSGVIPTPTLFPMDMLLGRDGTLPLPGHEHMTVWPLRVYLAEERQYVSAGQRVDLDRLHGECVGIRDRLALIVKHEGRPASIIVVPRWP